MAIVDRDGRMPHSSCFRYAQVVMGGAAVLSLCLWLRHVHHLRAGLSQSRILRRAFSRRLENSSDLSGTKISSGCCKKPGSLALPCQLPLAAAKVALRCRSPRETAVGCCRHFRTCSSCLAGLACRRAGHWRAGSQDRCSTFLLNPTLYSYSYGTTCNYLRIVCGEYEAGRLYGRFEVLRQCTEHGGPNTVFKCCFTSFWAPTIRQQGQNSGWAMFHDGGCWAEVAISASGVQGRTNIGLALILDAVSPKTNHAAPCA